MAFNELIKNFDNIRQMMRDFYVFGFKSRADFADKSARSYDNERRRIESWLGEYMYFRQKAGGKNCFISVDSRKIRHNPFYKALKAKSFTANDIMLHFFLLDILQPGEKMTLTVQYDKGDETEMLFRVLSFGPTVKVREPEDFKELIRKKLREQLQCSAEF